MEGREAPRRKPGRPRKPKPIEIAVDLFLEDPKAAKEDGEEQRRPSLSDVDPEQALELMFKEAEEKRHESGEAASSSRTGRRRRVPQRFSGVVQGKELDAILKDEGVIGPEESEEEVEAEELEMGEEEEEVENIEDEENDSEANPEGNEGSTAAEAKTKLGRPKKRRFDCPHCRKTFLYPGHLSHHIRTRHKASMFVCLDCKEKFKTKEELADHQQKLQHVGEGVEEDVLQDSLTNEEDDGSLKLDQDLQCLSCKELFTQQADLTNHIVEKHVTEKNNVCDICGKTFSHSTSVQYHKEVCLKTRQVTQSANLLSS